ncbi:MAG: PP2C family protein-serine/threonine phosphatase [Oscillospiraceae bacterium]|nr:PP2C family protein-serine/threonine phosphatase [Oscillospiraceae bacterium]
MREYKKIKTRRGTIAGRNISHLALLGLFLILGVSFIAGQMLYKRNLKLYTENTYSYTHLIADNISGSAPTKFLETGTEDDEYFAIRSGLMTAGMYDREFKDIYLVVPAEDELICISEIYHNLPAGSGDLQDAQAEFLERRPYRSGEKEIMLQALDREKLQAPEELYIGVRELGGEKLATALVPLHTADDEVPALVGVDVSIAEIWQAQMNLYLMLAITIIAITCIGMILHYRVLERTMIRPIQSLKQDTDELVSKLDSDEEYVSDVRTGDELEALAHSVEDMDRNLKHYLRENTRITAERERLSTELALSARIQEDMLPRSFPPFPDRKEFALYAEMDPAKEVGGDFYDFFLIDEDHLGLVMADVSGKGIPAALFMMKCMVLLHNCVLAGLGPKRAMEQLNEQIAANNSELMFVTVWLGVLEISSGRMQAVNAGHEYPILKSPGGRYELVKDPHGMAAGTMEGISYREYALKLEPGSMVFVYSDGLPEANDEDGRLFGTDRVLEALNSAGGQDPEAVLRTARAAVDGFVGTADQFDDLTMLCLAYYGPDPVRPEGQEAMA